MLIHATITISGDRAMLIACEARLRQRLAAHYRNDEVTEHHADRALCYDLKVEGGIPFPLFAEASQEFPGLQFSAEWVNIEAGERGSATIVDGRMTEQRSDRLAGVAAGARPAYVAIADDGSLRLALTLTRAGRDEWRGYAASATRDALLRVLRGPGPDDFVLHATEGGAEWVLAWSGRLSAAEFECAAVSPPIGIEDAVFDELEQLAQSFAADWLWFMSAPDEETAIERERYARRGYAVSAANLRSDRLYRMQVETGNGGVPLEYSTLAPEDQWISDLVLATWAREEGEG